MNGIEAVSTGRLPMVEEAHSWPASVAEFEALVGAYQHRLVHFAYCRLQSLEDAEDLVQEVLVRAWRDRRRYESVDRAGPLLYRMVANLCVDVVRKRNRRNPQPDAAECSNEQLAVRRLRWVESMLSRLPKRQAEVIRLRIFGSLQFEDIAAASGCSIPTVKSRFRYGVQKLRNALKKQGGER